MPESIGLEALLDLREFQSGVDRYLSQLYRLERDTENFTSNMTTSWQDLGKVISLTAVVALTGFSAATAYATGRFEAFVSQSIEEAAMLEDELGTIAAVLGTNIDAIADLRDVIEELAIDPTLKVNTFEAAKAIEILARNGQDLETIMDGAARATIAMANSTGGSFEEAARVVTDVMNIFGIEAANMEDVINGATAVVNNSKFDLNDYFLTLANSGAVIKNLGGDLDEFNAVLIGISSSFNTGRRAGTAFSNVATNLVPKSKAAAQVMAALGLISEEGYIKFFDNQGAFLGWANAAEVLKTALGDLSEAERSFYIRTLFGIDAQEAVIALMNLGAEGVNELKQTVADTSAYEAAATRMQTLAGRWEIFLGILEAARVNFGFKIIPSLSRGLDALNNILEDNYESMGKMGDAFGLMADKLVDWLIPIAQEWIPKLGDVMTELGDYLIEVVETGVVFNDLLEKLPPPLQRVIGYLTRTVKWFGDLAYWVKLGASRLMDFFGPFVEWLQANVTFEDVLAVMTIAVSSFLLPLIAAIVQVGAFAVAATAAVTLIRESWEKDWGNIQEFVKSVLDRLVGFFNTLVEIASTLKSRFGPDFLSGLEQAFVAIQPYVLKFLDAIQFVLDKLLLIAEGNWRVVWDEMRDAIREMANDLVTIFSEIDWGQLFDRLRSEVETRIAPIRAKIEEEISKIDWSGMFNKLQSELELRLAPIRAKIEEELGKIDAVAIVNAWWDRIDSAFGVSAKWDTVKQTLEEKLNEIEQKFIAFREKVEEEKTKLIDAVDAYMRAVKGEPVSEAEIEQYPMLNTIVTIVERIKKARATIEDEITKLKSILTSYMQAWQGESPESQGLPMIGAVGALGDFNRKLDEFNQSLDESDTVDWVQENIKLMDIFSGFTSVLAGLSLGFNLVSVQMAAFFAFGIAESLLFRKAWETNWASIRDYTVKIWPEIQGIGDSLLALGSLIWKTFGPDIEAAVEFLLASIVIVLETTNTALAGIVEWFTTGDGQKLIDWFETDFPEAVAPTKQELDSIKEAFDNLKTSMGEFVAYLFSDEFGGKLQGLSDFLGLDLLYVDIANVITMLDFLVQAITAVAKGQFGNLNEIRKSYEAWQKKAEEQRHELWMSKDRGTQLTEQDYKEFFVWAFIDKDIYKQEGEDRADSFVDGLTKPLVSLTSDIDMIGQDIVGGLEAGLKSGQQAIIDTAVEIGQAMLDGLKALLGIQSPSTVMSGIGSDTIQGMIDGINKLAPTLIESTQTLLKKLLDLWTTAYEEILSRSDEYTAEMQATQLESDTSISKENEQFISEFLDDIKNFLKNWTDSWKDGLSEVTSSFTDFVSTTLNKVGSFFTDLVSKAQSGVAQFVSAFSSMGGEILAKFTSAFDGVISSLNSYSSQFFTIGQGIVQGFIDGIGSMISSASAKLAELVGISAQATATAAEIQSPSKLFERLGILTGMGYLQGIERTFSMIDPMIARSMRQAGSSLAATSRMIAPTVQPVPAVASSYYRNTSTSVTNAPSFGPFQVNNSLSVAQLQQLIRREINRSL